MRFLSIAVLLMLATHCGSPPEPPRIELVSLRRTNDLDPRAVPKPGHTFATLHLRHAAESDRSCDLDWDRIVVVGRDGRRYTPTRSSESRGRSSSNGLFGREEPDVITPHEIRAVYEIPDGTEITRAAVGEWLVLTPSAH